MRYLTACFVRTLYVGVLAAAAVFCRAQDQPDPDVAARLKQLHAAFEAYRADHGGVYPPLVQADTAGGRLFWPELLKPYLGDDSPRGRVSLDGPFFAPYVPAAERSGGKTPYVSFGYPRFSLGADAPGYKRGRRPVCRVPNPADTLLLVECEAPRQPGMGWYSAYPNGGMDFARYRGKAHVLFCDGTVKLMSPEQLNVGDTPDTAAAPWNGRLSQNPELTVPVPPPVPAPVPATAPPPPPAKTEAAPRPRKVPARPPVPDAPADTPIITVPRIDAPPDIDGRFGRQEWAACSAFAGYSDYVTRDLAAVDVTSFAGYDDTALYLAFLVRLPRGTAPRARVTERDGRVYKEDAVEIILQPSDPDDIRQVIVNALGTVFDRRGAETSWNPAWTLATGSGTGDEADAPPAAGGPYWFLEVALPFASLEAGVPVPGASWRMNVCTDGQLPRVFAPTFESYLAVAEFATMVFLGEGEPVLHLSTLGKPTYGEIGFGGHVANSGDESVSVTFRVDAEKQGTRIVERTGFDEIVGALFGWEETVEVAGGATVPLALTTAMEDARLDRIRIEATAVSADGTSRPLYRQAARLRILPPLRLALENYPTNEELVLHVDISGLGQAAGSRSAAWRILDADGRDKETGALPLQGAFGRTSIDVSGLEPGSYNLSVQVRDAAGRTLADGHEPFVRARNPAWFRNEIGKDRIVLPPFTPVVCRDRTVDVWGRSMTWSDDSLLPAEVSSADTSLLVQPGGRLVVTVDGREQSVALDRFEVTAAAPDRVDFRLAGGCRDLRAEAVGWVACDGLVWYDLVLTPRAGETARVEACRIDFSLSRHAQLYYHAVPDRGITGGVGDTVLEFPDQTYFWVGSCEKGLGLVLETGPALAEDVTARFRLVPEAGRVIWQTHLIDHGGAVKELRYTFGIQATPVRPLPPDWHSWLSLNFSELDDPQYSPVLGAVDMTTIWEHFRGSPDSWWRPAFCDPMGVRTDRVAKLVEGAHEKRIPAILYSSPMNFTDNARPEHEMYAHEWCTMPRTHWKCVGFTQTRACSRSSYTDWLLYHFRNTVRESGLDGLYFDGASSGECTNRHHGCGWVDANGNLRSTRQILPNREFNRRIAVMLHQEVEPRALDAAAAVHRPNWPTYYNWIHISGAVCPPVFSFNTAYFCGEWFKGAIHRGKSYRELLTLDTFRPRYLSTPWGVPNFFLPITRENKGTVSVETECILAYMLPHGVPVFPRYLNRDVMRCVLTAMVEFDTKGAAFTPCWRENDSIRIGDGGTPDLLLATWQKEDAVLVVLANVGGETLTPTLNWLGDAARAHMLFSRSEPWPDTIAPDASFPANIGPYTFELVRFDTGE